MQAPQINLTPDLLDCSGNLSKITTDFLSSFMEPVIRTPLIGTALKECKVFCHCLPFMICMCLYV